LKVIIIVHFLLKKLGQNLKKLTRNQKHHLEGSAIPAGCNAKCCATWLELFTISIVTVGSIWHKLGVQLVTFWKISTAVLRILWRHLPTELPNV